VDDVKVTFYKLTEKRVSTWVAVRGKRSRIPGSTMALGRGDMPHDLLQLVVEATRRGGPGLLGQRGRRGDVPEHGSQANR